MKKGIILCIIMAFLLAACTTDKQADTKSKVSKTALKKAKPAARKPRASKPTGPITYRAVRKYKIAIDSTNHTLSTYTGFCDINADGSGVEYKTETESFDFLHVNDSLYLTRNNTTEVYYGQDSVLDETWTYTANCEGDECVELPQGTSMERKFFSDSMTLTVIWKNYCFMDTYDNFDVHPTDDSIAKTNCREGEIHIDTKHSVEFRLEELTEDKLEYTYSLGDKECTYSLHFGTWTPKLCEMADTASPYLGVSYRYETNTEEFNLCMAQMYADAGLTFVPKIKDENL